MTIKARIIEDSISDIYVREGSYGPRLTTFLLTYPRFIHAELMTHRVFSRNASSSRAIPIMKMIKMIREDPATFVHWGTNKPGMQAGEELTGFRLRMVKYLWILGMFFMTTLASMASRLGAHKQIVNRMTEPWAHITVVVTATEWDNFWDLRCHPDAQPEFRTLAYKMKELYDRSAPKKLKPGEWHLPFVSTAEREQIGSEHMQCRVSTARCARTSYLTHDNKKPRLDADINLFNRLVGSTPIHASPTEHQATPDGRNNGRWENPDEHGNLEGWIQFRKLIEDDQFRD